MSKKTSFLADRGFTMKRVSFGLGLMVAVLWAQGISAQFTQQGGKLVGSGSVGTSLQGCAVAVSADGNTAIVGGYRDSNFDGAAWVFSRSGGVWTQQGGKLVGTGAVGIDVQQGTSVAISGDGNTVIVGGPEDAGGAGAAWVFTRSGGVWTQQGGKLVGTGGVGITAQGSSVGLSADGDTALVGGIADDDGIGAAWVFTRSGGVWTQQGGKLVGTGGAGSQFQGWSAALSADGDTAVVGGPEDNTAIGAAWVFTRSGGVWTQQGGKLVGTGFVDSTFHILLGYSVAISADGDTIVVGGPEDDIAIGAAWVFTRSGGVWTQQGNKLVGTYLLTTYEQGSSVAVSGDGNTAIVGGPDDFSLGGAGVFTRSGGVWTQQGDKLVGTGAVAQPAEGTSVAISADGTTAVLGGSSDNSGVGAAWIFVASATQLALVQQPTDAVSGQDIAPAVTVQLEDSSGDPVAQAGVTVGVSLSSGTGTLSGTLSQATDASGVATFNDLSIDLVGSKQLTASSGSLTSAVSDSFMITAGAAASLTATGGTPQSAIINTQFPQPLEVTVTDAAGNPLSGVTVTFTAPTSGPSAALSNGGSVTTDANGHASVTATANGIAGGPYLVTASAGTLTPVSFSLTNQQENENAIPMLGGAGLLAFALAVLAIGLLALRWWRIGA
jgi:hypothetical protein